MTEAEKLAAETGCSLRTAQRRLKAARPAPLPPPHYRNQYRRLLTEAVYKQVLDGVPYLTAARNVLAACDPEKAKFASGDPRPVTPRRLAAWTRPK